MARRTNYGFEKKQRELRKQKKKKEKAERRAAANEEAGGPASESGTEGAQAPSETGAGDHD